MMDACRNVRGLRILDSGCGEGRFCRILIEQGAEQVVGVDLCEPMVTAAKELASGKDEYYAGDVQDLSFLNGRSFDLAVSYLNQCDLPNFKANNRAVFQLLRPGGRFVIANLHPMRSATGAWRKTEDGKKEHVILDYYFEEGERSWNIMGTDVTNFHRTLSSHIHGYRKSGFEIDDVIEPTVNPEDLDDYPELEDELRVPNFIIFVLRKPGNR